MFVITILAIAIYFTGLTASIYYWARTQQWQTSHYSNDEDFTAAMFWFVYWPIRWLVLLISLPFTLAAELGKQHRKGEK